MKRFLPLGLCCFLLLAVFCFGTVSHAQAATILGVNHVGNVYHIDDGTGATTFVGASGFSALNSLAQNHGGTFYSASGSTLITIHPLTGVGTSIVSMALNDIRGLAFNASDVLYALVNDAITAVDRLYTINTTTGAHTLIGSTTRTGLHGLDYFGGTFYAWDVAGGLYTLNAGTGAATYVGGTAVDIQSLVFRSDGTLFGIRNRLFKIDPNTGIRTNVGPPSGHDIRGIEFIESLAVPEPSTLTLLSVAGVAFAVCLRRRKLQSAP